MPAKHNRIRVPWLKLLVVNRSVDYVNKVLATTPIAFWLLNEVSGNIAYDSSGNQRNGTYSNVTLNQSGVGGKRPSARFDGALSYLNIYSSSLASAFSSSAGSLMLWAKVYNSGVWTDGTLRVLCQLRADVNNFVQIRKTSTNNALSFMYVAGGTNSSVSGTTDSTKWICYVMAWDKSSDEVKNIF